ncbi:ABC transporter B family member 21 isoform X2 [Ricinus communis]|uniref:ABC transporter B family member 21 isoform X2 n=1 Tax=Ricinus communis TaxID=3988 RepID=UPI000772A3C7|nr:ABC transporter B family member 21 isoform X2 [Ricinus communis]|eukprot:XP_025013137.1 ABC transporter B family member 21 isoform X2 [Ricinus communis]
MADESNWSEHMNKEETTAHSSVSEGEKIPEYMSNQQDTEKVNDKEKDIHTVPYYKLFSFADSLDILLITIGTVAAFGNGICMPLMTILLGELIDSIGKSASTSTVAHNVAQVSLKFIYLALGSGFASFFQVACWMITGERQAARIRSLYLKAVLRQDISFFDKEANTGEVVGRMSGDTILIQDAMGEKVGNFIQLLASFVGGFLVAFLKGWLLTLVMLSLIPPIVLSGAIMNKLVGKLASRGQTSYTVAANILEQTIGSIRTVASFTGEKHAVVRYNKSLSRAYDSGVQEGLAAGVGFGTLMFILLCSYGFAVWFGGRMVLEKGYTGGNVLNVIFSLLTGSLSLGQASPCINAFAAGQAAAVKIFEAINRKPEIDAYDTKGLKLEEIHGDIELRNVYFSYPSRPHEQIFCGFCLSVPSGTTTALVGHSGSGKSTVISLIERFYDPQAGEVLIDGVNLKEFQLKWIRKNIGLVSQEPLLFTSSIRENIAYGKEGATMEEIRAAADLANAANVINMLPKGLDTMVGEHGIQLSGGQKQRIAIARAVLKNPRILILDEATSALDAESERMVQVALDRVMINRTTLMVAHRLSTVRNANMIAVMQKGKIVQKGCRLIKRIRLMFFEKVVNMEIAWFDEPEHSSGAIGASLSADAAAMRGLVGDTFALLIQNTATGIAGLVIAFHANWQIALVILVLLPLMGLSGYVQLKSMKGFNANAKKMYEKASQVASDAVSSIRTVASFCAEEKVMQLYQKNCDGPLKAGKMRALISGIGFGLSFFFLFFFYAVSFYVGAHLVDHGKATFTEVFRVFFALSMAALGISQSNSLAPDANKARSSAASIFTILDQKSKIDPSDPSGTIIENLKGEIEFRHVGFQYPLRPDIQIFQDFSLAIQSGKIVALVGESGSGKSTVIALLQRFYNPDSGKITLDGIEIQRLRLKWLRQQMGLVSQEPVLFNDSIRANIAYGREANATEAEIMAAAELANAHCFISSLKQGYDTIVGERGVQLSGGQKQRVAIARAIVKAPRILLLDEATSALDAESERGVQDALERVMVGRTTLVIAHRLSTIKCADKIAVLKNGEIVEKGKHKTLINIKNGIYASLMAPQSTASS